MFSTRVSHKPTQNTYWMNNIWLWAHHCIHEWPYRYQMLRFYPSSSIKWDWTPIKENKEKQYQKSEKQSKTSIIYVVRIQDWNPTSTDQDHLQKSTKNEPFYTLWNLWEFSSSLYSTMKKIQTLNPLTPVL